MAKILIADDDVHIRELITLFLRNEGFEIVVGKRRCGSTGDCGEIPKSIWLSLTL